MNGTIYIETQPTFVPKQYALEQTFGVGAWMRKERAFTENYDNRMIAAITNCGLACKWAIEVLECKQISIVPDTDGLDVKFGGEQNDLFKMIETRRAYYQHRNKYVTFFGRDVRLLDRIRDLADQYSLTFVAEVTPVMKLVNNGRNDVT